MKLKRLVNRFVLGGMLIGSLAFVGYCLAKKTNLFDGQPIPVVLQAGGKARTIEVPKYNLLKIPPGYCARYARKVAEDVFNFKYTPADAWDMHYVNSVVSRIKDREDFETLVSEGIIKPGMMVGLFNPRSPHQKKYDKQGKLRMYTHVAVYLGRDTSNRSLVAHQDSLERKVEPLSTLTRRGWRAMEILAPASANSTASYSPN